MLNRRGRKDGNLCCLTSEDWHTMTLDRCRDNYRYSSNGRVVVIGDLHGHYTGFLDVLRCAGLIDDDLSWSGGTTTLVQMGDIFGRGDQGKGCAELLMALQRQSAEAGGLVLVLLGNHEAMITHGALHYVPFEEIHNFSSSDALDSGFGNPYADFAIALSPSAEMGGWLRSLPVAVTVDDYLFVHGGLEYNCVRRGLEWLNAKARANMVLECEYCDLPEFDLLFSKTGPLWNRRLISGPDRPQVRQELYATLSELEATAMIVGHTPAEFVPGQEGGKVVRKYDDTLIGVDVGINPIYGEYCGWLEITNGQLTPQYARAEYDLVVPVA